MTSSSRFSMGKKRLFFLSGDHGGITYVGKGEKL